MRGPLVVPVLGTVLVAVVVAPAGAIVFGEPDGELHPNVGTMVVEWEPGEVSKYCSGTLISPTVFLTAAHCTADLLAVGMEDVGVSFNTVFDAATATVYTGTIHQHPGYDALKHYSDPHDLAVVVFDSPIGITPAELPRSPGWSSTCCRTTGTAGPASATPADPIPWATGTRTSSSRSPWAATRSARRPTRPTASTRPRPGRSSRDSCTCRSRSDRRRAQGDR